MANVFWLPGLHVCEAGVLHSLRFAERPPTIGGSPTGSAFSTLPDIGSGGRGGSGTWPTCYVLRGPHAYEAGVLHLPDSRSGRRL